MRASPIAGRSRSNCCDQYKSRDRFGQSDLTAVGRQRTRDRDQSQQGPDRAAAAKVATPGGDATAGAAPVHLPFFSLESFVGIAPPPTNLKSTRYFFIVGLVVEMVLNAETWPGNTGL
jgi:hypothetical protein